MYCPGCLQTVSQFTLHQGSSEMRSFGHVVILVAAVCVSYRYSLSSFLYPLKSLFCIISQLYHCYRALCKLYILLYFSVSDEHSNALDFGPLIPPKLGDNLPPTESFPCVCGVFLTGQFVKGSRDPPRGNAALLHENSDPLPCNPFGNKQCTNKCLDLVSIMH